MMFVSLGLGAAIALALIVVVSVLTGGHVKTNSASAGLNQPQNALVGRSVKGFDVGGLNGGKVRAPYVKGHPGVLIFFASYCGPCRAEMPKVATFVRTHHEGTVEVVGIDTTDQRNAAKSFVKGAGVTFPIAFDPNGAISSGIFSLQAIPDTVFVNAKGIVTEVYIGAIPDAQLAQGIAALKRT